jgi:hypothetical protein
MLSRGSMDGEPHDRAFAWTVGAGVLVLAAMAFVELSPPDRPERPALVGTTTLTAAIRSSTAGGVAQGPTTSVAIEPDEPTSENAVDAAAGEPSAESPQ